MNNNIKSHYKVCILTAGKGSRVSPLTENINKSVLPLGKSAVISQIINKFPPETYFVIAVGYLKNTVKEYLRLAHPTSNIEFVEIENYDGVGSGPGHSLLECENYLQCPFIFYSCDTVVLDQIPFYEYNWVGIAKTDNPEIYCTVYSSNEIVTELIDKSPLGTDDAFIGLANIHDYKIFFDGLKNSETITDSEVQVTEGLRALIEKGQVKGINFDWYDTGTLESYKSVREKFSYSKFDFSKTDEYIYFQSNRVIKYFSDHRIAEQRYKRAEKMKSFVPDLISCKNGFYAYHFTEGNVLYDCDIESISTMLFDWLAKNFWKTETVSDEQSEVFRSTCLNFYKRKTIDRLNLFDAIEPRNTFRDCKINGLTERSAIDLLSEIDWITLSNGIPSRFHGDLQFDNILFSETKGFNLIDWRQDFSGLTDYGDRYYDYGKLLGGMIISYKQIKEGDFFFEFDGINAVFKLPTVDALQVVKEKYYSFLDQSDVDVQRVCILTSLIFLNMSPLHSYPFSHLLNVLGRNSLSKSLRGIRL